MRILIISDTHGSEENFERVLKKEKAFDYLIHCGDVEGQEDLIEAEAGCPCSFVAGNCDYSGDLPQALVLTLEGIRILVAHGHAFYVSAGVADLAQAAAQNNCRAAFYGHTHKPLKETCEGIQILNPGSLSYPRQRNRRYSYAVAQILDGELETEIRYL